MILIPTLSHMPYLDGERLIFCQSPGVVSFAPPQSVFDLSNGIAPRQTTYQPWSLAIKQDGVVTPVAHSFVMDSPMRIFCNPVLSGEDVSFIFSRQLYTGRIVDDTLTDLEVIHRGLFTGFKLGSRTVIGKAPCASGSQLILIDGDTRTQLNTSLDSILRVVPYGSAIIVTGRRGTGFISVLWQEGTAFRIKVAGQDVYKCCLTDDAETVIHAVRAGGFEERYLFSDPVELIEMEDFLQTN